MKFSLFDQNAQAEPPATADEIAAAEAALGVRLPRAYREMLLVRNGGILSRRKFRTSAPTSWAPDHIQVDKLLGVTGDTGIAGRFGTRYMANEWGLPESGVMIFDTPACGHDAVMLDYSNATAEPPVIYVDDDRTVVLLASSFEEFVDGLEPL